MHAPAAPVRPNDSTLYYMSLRHFTLSFDLDNFATSSLDNMASNVKNHKRKVPLGEVEDPSQASTRKRPKTSIEDTSIPTTAIVIIPTPAESTKGGVKVLPEVSEKVDEEWMLRLKEKSVYHVVPVRARIPPPVDIDRFRALYFDDDTLVYYLEIERSDGPWELAYMSSFRALMSRKSEVIADRMRRLCIPQTGFSARNASRAVHEPWDRCESFQSPDPAPDCTFALNLDAFTRRETEFLDNADGSKYWCITKDLYFPLIIGEFEADEDDIVRAGLESTHAGAMAVKAVLELCNNVPACGELSGEILAFSVIYGFRGARVFGHYAIKNGGDTSYYKKEIGAWKGRKAFETRWRTYSFFKHIYLIILGAHVLRIKYALAHHIKLEDCAQGGNGAAAAGK